MSGVYESFAREMEVLSRRYRGLPEREMLHLLLLALEREEIVSVGYRETMILQRLRSMPIPVDVQDLMHHALVWAWKDEQMHAIYLRGAILRLGNRGLRSRAYLRQMMGFMGGWAGSVRQHLRWTQAPLSHTLATGITLLGALTGIVPKDAREYLRFRPFRDFCTFNVDAEKTAALCYERMMEILPQLPGAESELGTGIKRVWEDEQNHTAIFAFFEDALDEQDRLITGETLDSLARKVGGVGEYFLPRSLRSTSAPAETTSRKRRVWVEQGRSVEEKLPLFCSLLDAADLETSLAERAHLVGKPISELKVVIKASFMMGYDRRDRSVITDPDLLKELAEALHRAGARRIAVGDARNIYDTFYQNRTVKQVADYFGISSPCFDIVDFSEEQTPHTYARGMAQHTVARSWKEADFRISFAKMRTHATEQVYLTVGNLDGVGARTDEFLFAERQAQRETAVMMIMSDFPPDLSLIDGYESAADGLLGMMGCPRPKTPFRLYAAADGLALDMVAARHLGMDDPRRSSMLNSACHWFGDPFPTVEIVGEDTRVQDWRGPYSNDWTAMLSLIAYPVYEFASCRGALFVPEMDTTAFPPTKPEGLLLRAGRRVVQSLLGLRHRRG